MSFSRVLSKVRLDDAEIDHLQNDRLRHFSVLDRRKLA
jgi:hypothetical protein